MSAAMPSDVCWADSSRLEESNPANSAMWVNELHFAGIGSMCAVQLLKQPLCPSIDPAAAQYQFRKEQSEQETHEHHTKHDQESIESQALCAGRC